ncbi:hypothetical protein J8V57_09770 [Xenorhabdus sp. PB61.4]|uniref:hypothetical protein n=1 Tax=Xenorhabdus sp. PB61.4 TaxID=2788940 RepID=UPI001E55086E|nr:hypothetical protein [Xenorhabdus sp. PB61.4]MCC8366568.1 hypothetical protein [Xenorhabdus sp. PB61.4]
MDLSRTIIPKSDQINFEDVQTQSITAVIKSVRAGSKDQPVFIDLVGYDGRPYKPSKSMRRVLIGGWGSDGHSWAGKSLTLIGDPTVKYGGVAVGGIKIYAMSDIEADFSMMLSVSRGKRAEHRVKKLETNNIKQREPDEILREFTEYASNESDSAQLQQEYANTWKALDGHPELQEKCKEVTGIRIKELKQVA